MFGMRFTERLHKEVGQIAVEVKHKGNMIEFLDESGISYKVITDPLLVGDTTIVVIEYYSASSIMPVTRYVEMQYYAISKNLYYKKD